jgi:hypothetical protein
MNQKTEDHWNAVYREKPVDTLSWYQARPATSLDLITRVTSSLDARIIDIGGGASTLVDHLLDAGYRHLSVLDIAEGALAAARERIGQRAVVVAWHAENVTTWTPAVHYDVWHDRAVFHFLTEAADRRAYRQTLLQALVLGGYAVIATFATDGPEKCSGLPVVRYDAAKLRGELGQNFELIEQQEQGHLTPGGNTQSFNYFLLRRTA